MPFPATVYRQRISFEIPVEIFRNLLSYEAANHREFDLPVLSTMLDTITGVDDTDYNGHFGSQISADFDVGEDGKTPQVAEFQAMLDDFFLHARRIADIIPEMMTFPRHDLHELSLDKEPEPGYRRSLRSFIYGDDDFLISTGEDDETVTIFHRENGSLGMVDAKIPLSVWKTIAEHRNTRSFDRSKRKPITMSKDLKGVRKWVQTHVELDIRLPTVEVEGHDLAGHLPEGARPVLAHKKFIVSDCGRDTGLSVTFMSEGEPGTKWFVDDARRSVLWNIERANGVLGGVNGWILRQLPYDVEHPGVWQKLS